MTRGRIYLRTKNNWIESRQLLYDMGYELPHGHGTEIISAFLRRQMESKKKLDELSKSLFDSWEKGGNLNEDEELSYYANPDATLCIEGVCDDYSYIMNCSSKCEKIIVADNEIVIERDEMVILFFSKVVKRIRRKKRKSTFKFE